MDTSVDDPQRPEESDDAAELPEASESDAEHEPPTDDEYVPV
jgi:hypothetical protein